MSLVGVWQSSVSYLSVLLKVFERIEHPAVHARFDGRRENL